MPQSDRPSGCIEVHQRLSVLEEMAKSSGQGHCVAQEGEESRSTEAQDTVATRDPYQCEPPVRKRGRPATLKHSRRTCKVMVRESSTARR
eukprot:2341895-Amphidinium_carterae.2